MAGEFIGPRVECTIDSLLNRYIVNWLLDTCLYFQTWPAPILAREASFHCGQKSVQNPITGQSVNNKVLLAFSTKCGVFINTLRP